MPTKRVSIEQRLVQSVKSLDKTIEGLPDRYAYVFHPGKNLWLTFLRGIVYGLGIITAFAIVIPIFIGILQATVEWVPLISGFVERVIEQVENTRFYGA